MIIEENIMFFYHKKPPISPLSGVFKSFRAFKKSASENSLADLKLRVYSRKTIL